MQADEELAATVREEVPGGHSRQMLSPVICAYAPALNLCMFEVRCVFKKERESARARAISFQL